MRTVYLPTATIICTNPLYLPGDFQMLDMIMPPDILVPTCTAISRFSSGLGFNVARPVYVQRDDRIKAHFLTCYISLLVYRLLEQKLEGKFTCSHIFETLRNMQMTLLSKESDYIPSYKRTALTDKLHDVFGFRTDFEFIS